MDELSDTTQAGPTNTTESGRWRTRLQGHATLLVLAAGIAIASMRPGANVLQLIVCGFPMVVGWIIGVIALEIGVARGDGARAIRSAVAKAMLAALVNLVLILVVFSQLKII
jgi:hypothetical protein